MAERMTQAQALLAVLAGGMRKERRYWRLNAIVSHFYPFYAVDKAFHQANFIDISLDVVGVFVSTKDTVSQLVSIQSIDLEKVEPPEASSIVEISQVVTLTNIELIDVVVRLVDLENISQVTTMESIAIHYNVIFTNTSDNVVSQSASFSNVILEDI